MEDAKKYNIWFALHALFFAFAISAVVWMPWYWLAAMFLILRLQDLLFGGCVLTWLEYGSWERRYTEERVGHLIPKRLLVFFPFLIDWLFPAILVALAFFFQK